MVTCRSLSGHLHCCRTVRSRDAESVACGRSAFGRNRSLAPDRAHVRGHEWLKGVGHGTRDAHRCGLRHKCDGLRWIYSARLGHALPESPGHDAPLRTQGLVQIGRHDPTIDRSQGAGIQSAGTVAIDISITVVRLSETLGLHCTDNHSRYGTAASSRPDCSNASAYCRTSRTLSDHSGWFIADSAKG